MKSERNYPLPTSITAIVRRLRRQIRWYIGLEGLTVAIAWLGIAFWVGLALDYLPVLVGANEMPRQARLIMLVVFSLVLIYLVYRFVIRRIFVRLADRSLALLLERQHPEFNDTLVTAVDTTVDAADTQDATMKQAMLQHAIQQAAAQSESIDTREALKFGSLLRKAVAAAVAVGSVVLFGWLAQDAFAIWTARLFLVSDEPWPRRTHIEVLDFPDGRRKVAEGSDLTLRVRAAADRPTAPPTICTVDFRLASGERGRVNMSRDGEPRDGFQYYRYEGPPFQAMLEALTFDVIGFDHRVPGLHVEVVARPSIVDVQLDCELPAYMKQPRRQLTWRPGTRLPVGTKITLTARVTKPLKHVRVEFVETGETENVPLNDHLDASTFQYSLDALPATTTLQFELLDHDDVASDQPYRLSINALDDEPPQLNLALQGIGTAITPQARLPILGEIRDDYQIKEAWFQLDRPADSRTHRVTFKPGTSGAVEQTLDLRQQRNDEQLPWELQPGDKLVLSVQASDFYDLADTPHIGQSDPVPLDVVTPQELLALLEARELNLKRRFEQTITEMVDTRDSLLRLKASLLNLQSPGQPDQRPPESSDSEQDDLSRDSSLRRLRVQRAQQQGAKDQQEVQGVAASFVDIRDELINNRVDSPERRQRLQDQIIRPLEVIVADNFTRWLDQLTQLEQRVEVAGPEALEQTDRVIQQTNDLILALQNVLENMLELETFNELLDLVRSILSEQEALLEKTKEEQKRQARALLED
jgi:hypothetical protein